MSAIKKTILALYVCFGMSVFLMIVYNAYMRHKRLQEPCVPFYQGMTLLPGQCATMPITVKEKPDDPLVKQ